MRKLFLVVLVCVLSFNISATALAGVKVKAGIRQVNADDILIKESATGAIKKGKNIYLRCKYVSFEDGVTYNVETGNGKIDKVSSEDGIIKISIKSESSTEPMTIRLSNVKMYLNGSLPKGSYPLELVTEESAEYPDNAFGETYNYDDSNFSQKYIIFDDEFFTVESSTMVNIEDRKNDKTVAIDSKEQNAYINSNGYVMLSLRYVLESLTKSAIISWNEESKTVSVIMGSRTMAFKEEESSMTINGNKIPLKTPMELKYGKTFLSLSDIGYVLGIPDDKLKWDEETKTAYLNYKGE